MKNHIWKHRKWLVGLFFLLIQVPFIVLKLNTSDPDLEKILLETVQIFVSSGLVGYLFATGFDSFLEKRMYGGIRRKWKEVRVMYSSDPIKGMGEAYPRDPTLLIQPPVYHMGTAPEDVRKDSLFAQDRDGKSCNITPPIMHRPMSVCFNTGYVGQPIAGEDTRITGKWSDLQLMQVGPSGFRIAQVGFPDTLVTLGTART
ncbi:MAG: hypothetical protein OXL40_10530 [Bacteroidota bacterium]|nr:hypothetical protein [Bacteroidota bacterium]